MFDKMEIFRMAQGLAMHAAQRQSTIAQNVANADTPGYRARDMESFADTYATRDTSAMRATRVGHMSASEAGHQVTAARETYRPGAASPNGNNVSLESEMMAAAEVKRDHDMALSIYQTSLRIMRSSLGR